MVHYLKFDARNGTHADPGYADGGNNAAIELLRVTDVLMVTTESANAQRVQVYYTIPNGGPSENTDTGLSRLSAVEIILEAAQTDYNFTNWLRDQIRQAIEMTTAGPGILDVTSIPPVLPNDIYSL